MGVEPQALGDFFDRALVSPVLTAHPTEVRRKSTLTRELEIAELLDERERVAGDEAELALNEEKLRRAILILWRTNMLRQTRLTVIDEVANGLSYYDYTFFRELPRLYGAIEDALDESGSEAKRQADPLIPARRLLDRRRPRRQSLRDRRRAATRRSACRARARSITISTSCTSSAASFRSPALWSRVSDELNALADRASDPSPNRRDEPYRRAITGMYSRLAKTARELDHVVALRHPLTDAPPYASVEELAADLDIVARSLNGERRRDPGARAAAGAAARGRRVRLSVWRRSTCGRTPTCTSAPSPSCSPPRRRASTTSA